MTSTTDSEPQDALDLDQAEEALKQALLRLYFVRNKLRAEGASQVPSLALELQHLTRRAEELISLWAALRRERALAAAERTLSESAAGEAAAGAMLERLRHELEQRAAERTLRRELGGL